MESLQLSLLSVQVKVICTKTKYRILKMHIKINALCQKDIFHPQLLQGEVEITPSNSLYLEVILVRPVNVSKKKGPSNFEFV